jgi:hypothetical protein
MPYNKCWQFAPGDQSPKPLRGFAAAVASVSGKERVTCLDVFYV